MKPIHVLHFYYTRASTVRECMRKRRRYSWIVAFSNKLGGRNLEQYIRKLPFKEKLLFSKYLNVQESIHLMLVFYALLYVTIEGYQNLNVKDQKIEELLKSEHLDLLRRCRNGVLHFQTDLFTDKITDFLLVEGTEIWAQKVFRNIGRFLMEQSEQFFADKI